MPGIAGILEYKSSAQTAQRLETMVTCLQREPNDRVGTIRQDDLNLRAGWVSGERDFSAIFPLWNEQRDICLVFFGEDFTESHRIERLISDGHILNSDRSDYLIHLYEEKGPGFIEKLNGNFSGLLIDLRQKLVLLFNDRYGLNRIYFYEDATGLYFSSEAKSLLKTFPALRSLDIKSLGEFLSCGCVLQNRTLFGGINLVPGGSLWTFTPGGPVKKQSYFSPDSWEAQDALSAGEYYRKLKQTWMDLLPRYFRGKRPIGVSLTGGIDSRMILAWAPPSPGSLACYTFGGHFRDCADVKISRRIARICRHNHELIPVGSQFLSRFAPLAEQAVYLSDGAMDVTGAIDLYLQEMAR